MKLPVLLCDFDGTLADTMPLWREAMVGVLSQHGGSASDLRIEQALDSSSNDVARFLQEAIGYEAPAEDLLRELSDRVHSRLQLKTPWMPGARRLLEEANAAFLRCALVSNSSIAMLKTAVADLPEGTFSCLVGSEDVQQAKPFPDAYRLACQRLGVSASEAIAIEDTRTGATAAAAAGVCVVHVGYPPLTQVPVAAEFATIEALQVSDLVRIHRAHHQS